MASSITKNAPESFLPLPGCLVKNIAEHLSLRDIQSLALVNRQLAMDLGEELPIDQRRFVYKKSKQISKIASLLVKPER